MSTSADDVHRPSESPMEPNTAQQGRRRQQLHVWVSADEYRLLQRVAFDSDRTVSSVVRRLIRALRTRSG